MTIFVVVSDKYKRRNQIIQPYTVKINSNAIHSFCCFCETSVNPMSAYCAKICSLSEVIKPLKNNLPED